MRLETPHDESRRRRARCSRRMAAAVALAMVALAPVPRSGGAASAPGLGVDAATARRVLQPYALRSLDGSTLTLGSLRGQVVVVNFWASWCGPCRRELPRLAALHAEIARRGGRVVAISIDHEAANARRFLQRNRIGLPVYHDGPSGLADRLRLQALPFTMVLDREGRVAFTSHGATDEAIGALVARTEQLVAAAPVAEAGEGGSR